MTRVLIGLLFLLPCAEAQAPAQNDPPAVPGAAASQDTEGAATFSTSTNLVLLHLKARNRDGSPIEHLTKDDFTVFEDDKPQSVSLLEFQRLSDQLLPVAPSPHPSVEAPGLSRGTSPQESFRDRRLLVLYLDYSSMDLGQQARATDAALRYLRTKMTVSDTVAIYAYSSDLRLIQGFTDNRDRLLQAVQQLQSGQLDLAYQNRSVSTADAELDLFKAESKLNALEEVSRTLARYPEKKAVIYISNGGKGTGIENLSQLRATTIAANRANVSFYTVDVRGLDASAPLGDAASASGKGADQFSGQAFGKGVQAALAQQDTMSSLAADTGGKMIHDTNDLSLGMQRAQEDLSSYYIVGYYSANSAADGKFRKVRVQMKTLRSAQLEYRQGYYAPKLFKLLDGKERDKQLQEAIQLDNPVTDVPLVLETNYFRVDRHKYFVSLSARIPGTAIPPASSGATQETEVDFLGVVENQSGKPLGRTFDKIRIKLTPDIAGELTRRGLQYETGFTLDAGRYTIKFVVRENQDGKMGTFEMPLTIPDLGEGSGLHLSSVVWSGQREKLVQALGSAGDKRGRQESNPLIRGDSKLVPSLTHTFNTGQSLIVYCELYDLGANPRIGASVGLYRGDQRVYQSERARIRPTSSDRAETVPIEVEFPLASLPPGEYTAQLNLIDVSGQKAGFVRKSLVIVAK